MNILTLQFNLFHENTMLLWKNPSEAIIVDPGFSTPEEKEKFYSTLQKEGLKPVAILLTHAHFDHIFGVSDLKEQFDIPVYMNPEDKSQFYMCRFTSGKMGFPKFSTDWESTDLTDKQTLSLGRIDFDVIFTPGHSPGSVCYYCKEEEFILTGDTLFAGTIGRTDLNGGDYDKLIVSIMEKLMILPSEVEIYPGHGPTSTIGEERMTNPMLEPFNEKEEQILEN